MKKFVVSSFASVMAAGTLFSGIPLQTASSESLSKVHSALAEHSKSTLDLSLVNDEKLLAALVKRGVISGNASQAQKQAALQKYLEVKGKADLVTDKDPLASKVKKAEATKHSEFKDFNNGLLHGNGKKNGQLKGTPDPVKESASPGVQKKGKLLTLMVEYSDLSHNKIKKEETDNWYPDFTQEHYEDMIFGKNGVKGPNGETFLSQKQYYEQQSGGTYTVDGKAYGWLKVPGTAEYYGKDSKTGHDNVTPGGSKQLIVDTYKAALAAGIPLQEYDLEDPHDLDGDGNYWEPDGLVDHLQIIHAGMGQEAGGGAQGDNAIWSHRSAKYVDDTPVRGEGLPGFYDYTIMPEDGATGVFAHEYGHDLGLPDEYDTIYSGAGEAVEYWSIMSAGSWAGKIPGTEPTGFSPWAKSYFQSTLGGKWTNPTVVNWEDVSTKGTQFLLDQANTPLGQNNQAIQVNLPKKVSPVNTPAAGTYEYWGGQADEMDNSLVTNVDLTGKASATLTFDAWYDMEAQWDFAFVQVSTDNGVTWKSLGNDHTRSDVVSEGYPTILNSMPGFTGDSKGWEAQSFDLSKYAGQKIQLRLRSATDWGTSNVGFFADNIKVVADGATIVEDGAESATSPFTLKGFTKFDGNKYSNHYYLLEWRNHKGADEGLAHINRGGSILSYDGGLVVWYVDDSFTENWTGIHPGDGFLGVVDAHDDTNLLWNYGAQASARFHVADAAFGLNQTSGYNITYPTGEVLKSSGQEGISLFNDSKDYNNAFLPDAGRNIGHYGLKVRVNGQSTDKSVGSIVVYK